LQYVEGQGHPSTMIFIGLLSLGMITACAFGMLRPWPPGFMDGLMFAIVTVICLGVGGGILWSGMRHSEVRMDRRTNEVTEQVRFFGLGRTRRWKLSDFETAQVRRISLRDLKQEARNRQNARPANGPDVAYVLNLIGPSARVRLKSWVERYQPEEGVLAAESDARAVAAFGGWRATRLDYRLQMERGTEAGTATKISIATADGQESAIGPESQR